MDALALAMSAKTEAPADRRVAAPPCAAAPSVPQCRASVPGGALQARPVAT